MTTMGDKVRRFAGRRVWGGLWRSSLFKFVQCSFVVCLVLISFRAILFHRTGRAIDNVFSASLGHYSEAIAWMPPDAGPNAFPGTVRTAETFIFDSRPLAETLAIMSGVSIWAFLSPLCFAIVWRIMRGRGRTQTRCRKCRGVLKRLEQPQCPYCGEPI